MLFMKWFGRDVNKDNLIFWKLYLKKHNMFYTTYEKIFALFSTSVLATPSFLDNILVYQFTYFYCSKLKNHSWPLFELVR